MINAPRSTQDPTLDLESGDFLADFFLIRAKLFTLEDQLLPLVIQGENAIYRLLARNMFLATSRFHQIRILSQGF